MKELPNSSMEFCRVLKRNLGAEIYCKILFFILITKCSCSSLFKDVAKDIKSEIRKQSEKKVNRELGKTGLISKSHSSSPYKKVYVAKLQISGKTVASKIYLPMKTNRFYLSFTQIKTYFGLNVASQGLLVDRILKGNSSFLVTEIQGSLMKDVVSTLLGKDQHYLVRDLARILNLNVSWNQKSKVLSFSKPLLGKGPLDRLWQEYLKKQGLLDYLDKIHKVLKAKKRSQSSEPDKQDPEIKTGPVVKDSSIHQLRFQNIYGTSFEAQTIASKGPRGDWKMRDTDVGCALPSRSALETVVKVFYPKTGKVIHCPVIDVGPWNIYDPYWVNRKRPAAEKGKDERGRKTNLAGIDLSYQAWFLLGVDRKKAFQGIHSDYVHWDFVNR